MERKPMVKKRRAKKKASEPPPQKTGPAPTDSGSTLGKVDVEKKAVRIQDLGDRVGFAIKQYEAAQEKFETGADSYKEWKNIIKLLNSQVKDVEKFLAISHHNLGVIHAGRRELDQAEELFKKAIEINPDYGVAYYNLAVIFKNKHDIIKAKEFLAKAKELGYAPREKK